MRLKLPIFIVLEGIDGSGKTTLIERLYSYYYNRNIPVVKLREPTDGVWGIKIKEMLKNDKPPDANEQVNLFLLDREEDVQQNILPALKVGKLILMDRYYYSNAAYQGAFNITPASILTENRNKRFPKPDRVYLIDIDPDDALLRIAARNKSKEEDRDVFEKKHFLQKVRENYLSICDDSFLVLDGSIAVDDLFQSIVDDIQNIFNE